MRVVIQKSLKSKVRVDDEVLGEIQRGLVLLVCFEKGDTYQTLNKACDKITSIRLFEDDSGRMNYNINDAGGELLVISQFTLSWLGTKGNRPSFDNSMPPQQAKKMFEDFCVKLKEKNLKVETGIFGALMKLEVQNIGPVTFSLTF